MSESNSTQPGNTDSSATSSDCSTPSSGKTASDPPAPFLWLAHVDEFEKPIWFLPLESEADSSVWDDETLEIEIVWWDHPAHDTIQPDTVDWQFDCGETLIRDNDAKGENALNSAHSPNGPTTYGVIRRFIDADSGDAYYELQVRRRGCRSGPRSDCIQLSASSVHSNYTRFE